MRREVDKICDLHHDRFDCPDCLIHFSPFQRTYGLIVHDGGSSTLGIDFCPWCGSSLRDRESKATSA